MEVIILGEGHSGALGSLLPELLRAEGVEPHVFDALSAAEHFLGAASASLVLLVEPLPSLSLLDACRRLRATSGGHESRIVAVTHDPSLVGDDQASACVDAVLGPEDLGSQVSAQLAAARRGSAPAVERVYRTLLDSLPDAVLVHDLDGRLLLANPAAEDLTGYPVDELLRRSIFDLFDDDDDELIGDQVRQLELLASQAEPEYPLLGPLPIDIRRADDATLSADLSLRLLRLPDRYAAPVVQAFLRDMTETARLSQELTAIQDVVQIIASETDIDAAFRAVLAVLVDWRGYTRASIWTLSDDGRELLSRAWHGDAVPSSLPLDRGVIGRVARTRLSVFLRDVSTDPDYVSINPSVVSEIAVPMLNRNRLIGVIDVESDATSPLDDGDLRFLRSLAAQIAGLIERAELHQSLARQATTDMVTGLPNRQAFQQELDAAFASTADRPFSLLVIGIDRFKAVNDVYGYSIADDVLRQVATTLRSLLQPGQFLARSTSDQFAVLLPGTDRDDAVTIAEKLRIAVATQLFMAAEQVEQLTISIGAATCPDDAHTPAQLQQAADHALYLAKRAGCNQTFQSNAALASLASAHGRINDLLRQSPKETITLLIQAMDQRLPERAGHSERVTRYSVAIAEWLGLPPDELPSLRIAAYIHDIGMMSIPDALLRKPTALTTDERKLLLAIPAAARSLLAQVALPPFVLDAVVHLREWYDGSGHPSGLSGEQIPLGARIIAVADAIDALTSPRAHRNPVSVEAALELVNHLAGAQFDPLVTDAAQSLVPTVRRVTGELRLAPPEPTIFETIMADLEQLNPEGNAEVSGLTLDELEPFVPPT